MCLGFRRCDCLCLPLQLLMLGLGPLVQSLLLLLGLRRDVRLLRLSYRCVYEVCAARCYLAFGSFPLRLILHRWIGWVVLRRVPLDCRLPL